MMTAKGAMPNNQDASPEALREKVKERAETLGFARVGIARAEPPRSYDAYLAWLDADYHGEMAYMAAPDHKAARRDLERVAENARSIISVALAYDGSDPSIADDDDVIRGRVAKYARGRDYHQVLKKRLYEFADQLAIDCGRPIYARPATDSAPILERDHGAASGLGFVGKNTMLISPGLGSYTVLGELLTDLEIAPTIASTTAAPMLLAHRCGDCRACLDACPTDAFAEPFVLNSNRCISYLTIEKRGSIPIEFRHLIGDRVFGCDDCQDVCPYNAVAPSRTAPDPELRPTQLSDSLPSAIELSKLGSNQWKRLSRNRAISRATQAGLVRNAAVVLGNSSDPRAIEPLAKLLDHRDEHVRDHASWALLEIAHAQQPFDDLGEVSIREYRETDFDAVCELHDLARLFELEASGLTAAFIPLAVCAADEGLFDGQVRVATSPIDGGRVVGFVATEPGEVTWVYVDPRAFRRGLGRKLLLVGLEHAGQPTEITVLAENAAALALYKAAGFVQIREKSGTLQSNPAFPARGITLVFTTAA